MTRAVAFVLVLAACVPAAGQSLTDRARAREELNLGVRAYKNGNYDAAIEHFKTATTLEPTLSVGHLYLGTAYAQRVVPGVDSPENKALAQHAILEFQKFST